MKGEPMTQKLTVLIPCKDERRNIRLCIESAAGLADELLIADSGSTDGTIEIVNTIAGARLIERAYVNSANFKNWAIPQAKHDWVLVLDADERITPALAEEIRKVLAVPDPNVDGYSISRLNHFLGHRIKRCGWADDRVIRLFRRDACRYRERWVHAEVEVDPSRISPLAEPMLHYTTWTTDQYVEKLNRYAGWGALNTVKESRKSTAPSFLTLATIAPLRFLQLYVLRLGFLDGVAGLQVCMYAAFYSFLKKSKRWELHHAVRQPDHEQDRDVASSGAHARLSNDSSRAA
jgi:glycosyltransferase involved in cell wall biosynthesis